VNEFRISTIDGRGPRSSPRLWIGIVDDHPVYRIGLVHALESQPQIKAAWAAADPAEALRLLQTTAVDALLTDINFNGHSSGLDLIATVHRQWPRIATIALSALADEADIAAAKEAGAVAYLRKDLPTEEMIRVLLSLESGNGVRGPKAANSAGSLSKRERDVLAEMRLGSTNREIAHKLGISTATVNKHVHKVLLKMGARNRAQAIALTPRG
jgi:DNA-binding NarL/FixJ family response regulator